MNKDESISQGNYKKINLNSSQGYIKPVNDDKEERNFDKSKCLTAKEKKIVEQNPNLAVNQLRKLNSKKPEKSERTNLNASMDFSTANNTFYNRVNFNNSNIFNDEVRFINKKIKKKFLNLLVSFLEMFKVL